MFLNVLRRKDLIQGSHVTTKSTRILQIAQGQFYFSNFFPHDAESLCCNLIYWCLLPDVLLAFAVEIFFCHRILNIITVFDWSCCVFMKRGNLTSFLVWSCSTHSLEAGPFVQAHCAAGHRAIYRVLIPSPASPEKENKVSTIASALCGQ